MPANRSFPYCGLLMVVPYSADRRRKGYHRKASVASQRKQIWLARGHRLDVISTFKPNQACKPVGIKAECNNYCGISSSASCIVLWASLQDL